MEEVFCEKIEIDKWELNDSWSKLFLGWDDLYMSIKKELLRELSERDLRRLAEFKGIELTLNGLRKKYYEGWNEKDKLVDIIGDHQGLSVKEIEDFINNRLQLSSGFRD